MPRKQMREEKLEWYQKTRLYHIGALTGDLLTIATTVCLLALGILTAGEPVLLGVLVSGFYSLLAVSSLSRIMETHDSISTMIKSD